MTAGAWCLISWRTSAQPVYIDPIQDQEVNLIIKLHKRANFLFNHFCNERRELWASWKPILWVLSGASCVLISLCFLVEHGSWDPALTSFSVMKDLPFSVIVSKDCVSFEQYNYTSVFSINTTVFGFCELIPIIRKNNANKALPASANYMVIKTFLDSNSSTVAPIKHQHSSSPEKHCYYTITLLQ